MKLLTHFILILLLLVLDFKASEHHHEDLQYHHDCELCIVQHQPQHTNDVNLELTFHFPTISLENPKAPQVLPSSSYKKHTLTRAPPTE
ncbi:hypothetical protein [Thermocrinis jamiesonii]|uniref:hypothetical protein n=1 Tax=Thermocrinis jamiesonii TaxID=1302351 RepID=UPI0012DC2B28|nr:hypothetical protein [Thermocrinis jamiesonii]